MMHFVTVRQCDCMLEPGGEMRKIAEDRVFSQSTRQYGIRE